MGDIEVMFHQILVENKDRDALRFLWRDNYINPIEDYRMNVHLFGNVDSPVHSELDHWKTAADQSDSYQNHREWFLHGRFLVFTVLQIRVFRMAGDVFFWA